MELAKLSSEKLYNAWMSAKEAEKFSQDMRRAVEDELKARWTVPEDLDGSNSWDDGEFKLNVTGRINKKVDAKKVEEIAAEHGLSDHLSSLFNWKPTINAKVWKATDPKITGPLLGAITSTPSRPSFKIEKIGATK